MSLWWKHGFKSYLKKSHTQLTLTSLLGTHRSTVKFKFLYMHQQAGPCTGGGLGARATAPLPSSAELPLSPNPPSLSHQLKAFSYRSAKDPLNPLRGITHSLCALSLEMTVLLKRLMHCNPHYSQWMICWISNLVVWFCISVGNDLL